MVYLFVKFNIKREFQVINIKKKGIKRKRNAIFSFIKIPVLSKKKATQR
jgi:hypothetical protein